MHASKARVSFAAIAAVLLLALAVATAGAHVGRHHAKAAACAAFRVSGKVATPLRLRVDGLRSYPAHEVDVTFQAGTATQSHHYEGALLTDVLASAGPTYDPAIKNDLLRFFAKAVG